MALPSRHIHQQFSLVGSLFRVADMLCVAGGLAIAVNYTAAHSNADFLLPGAVAIIVHYLVSELSGMYRSWRGASVEREMVCTSLAWAVSFTILGTIGFATGRLEGFSRILLVTWFVATPIAVVISHTILRILQRSFWVRGVNTKAFAIVGVTELGFQLARNIEESPELGLKLAGFYDDRPPDRGPEMPAGMRRRIGGISDLIDDAKAGFVDRIYITFPMRAEDRIRGVLGKLADTTASVYIVPDFFVFQLLHSRWTDVGGLPAVSVFENPLYGVDGVVKRVFDVIVGGLLLLALAPVMIITALLIKLTSRGPVFFRQRRYGLDGNEIFVWKFRSMFVQDNGNKVAQAVKGDPRVTWLGAILRKTSIDELPQLFNVMTGNMSLVGPRPHATAHNEQYRQMIEGYMLRHKVKPGITGLAQVRGWRGETDTLEKMQKRIECDHEYIREWSLLLDVKILFQTVWVVLSRQNAY